jgi:hypothetical protein
MYKQIPITPLRPLPKKTRKYTLKRVMLVVVLVAVLYLGFEIRFSNPASAISEVKSGVAGYCLNDHHDATAANTAVEAWSCNGTAAQNWVVRSGTITHNKSYCLSVQNNGTSAGDLVVSERCNGGSGQVWVSAIGGYENPSTALCLDVPNGKPDTQLVVAACTNLTQAPEIWQPSIWSKTNTAAATVTCSGSEGQVVACDAAKQWVTWQAHTPSHETLLNEYSDGNGYEEWCADFVSYVYKEAGFPFASGERDGWDEYLADNIKYQGLTYHDAAGYTPQAGDVAFFDYPGGHVEIVAIGGAKPLFIYGDSGTTDPTTGQGQMAENTITDDGSLGQVQYYLSPS